MLFLIRGVKPSREGDDIANMQNANNVLRVSIEDYQRLQILGRTCKQERTVRLITIGHNTNRECMMSGSMSSMIRANQNRTHAGSKSPILNFLERMDTRPCVGASSIYADTPTMRACESYRWV